MYVASSNCRMDHAAIGQKSGRVRHCTTAGYRGARGTRLVVSGLRRWDSADGVWGGEPRPARRGGLGGRRIRGEVIALGLKYRVEEGSMGGSWGAGGALALAKC